MMTTHETGYEHMEKCRHREYESSSGVWRLTVGIFLLVIGLFWLGESLGWWNLLVPWFPLAFVLIGAAMVSGWIIKEKRNF